MFYTARVEQTYKYPKRMKYIAETDSFIEKDSFSLGYIRGFDCPYGWICETGTPPMPHLDVMIMTDMNCELGQRLKVRVIGVFRRNDGDHKLVAVTEDRAISDYSQLDAADKEKLHRLYPREDPGEGWFGAQDARTIIDDFISAHALPSAAEKG